MIEIYVLVEEEPLMMEVELSLEHDNETIYNLCHQVIEEELNKEKEFVILLIKHKLSFLRNIELRYECFQRINSKPLKDILHKWHGEFSEMFGKFGEMEEEEKKGMVEFFFDEYEMRIKDLEQQYNELIDKKYGIPTKTRLEEKVRRMGVTN